MNKMEKILFVFLLVSVGILVFTRHSNAQQNIPATNEMYWWNDKPAAKYWEGLPVRTGRLAGMVIGTIAEDRLWLNEETLWSGGPNNLNQHSKC
jgi:alpha-L-fucosidase 2